LTTWASDIFELFLIILSISSFSSIFGLIGFVVVDDVDGFVGAFVVNDGGGGDGGFVVVGDLVDCGACLSASVISSSVSISSGLHSVTSGCGSIF